MKKSYCVLLLLSLSPLLFSAAMSFERAKALDDAARAKAQAAQAVAVPLVASGSEVKVKQDLAYASFIMKNPRLPSVIAQNIYDLAIEKGRACRDDLIVGIQGKISPFGRFITTLYPPEHIISVFDMKNKNYVGKLTMEADPRAWACSDCGDMLAVSNEREERLELYSRTNEDAYFLFSTLPVCPYKLAFSADSTTLAFIREDYVLCVLDINQGRELWRMPDMHGNIVLSDNGERVAAFSRDNNALKVIDRNTGTIIREFPSSGTTNYSLAISGDSNLVAYSEQGHPNHTSVWSVLSGKLHSEHAHICEKDDTCMNVQLSYDGSFLLVNFHKTAFLWQTITKTLKKTVALSGYDSRHYPLLASGSSNDLLIPVADVRSHYVSGVWSLATRPSDCEFVMARKKEREAAAAHALCNRVQDGLPLSLFSPIRALISAYMSHAVYGAWLRNYPSDKDSSSKI